ncbi:diacylglycerol kinase family protein [Paenibacillus swuensis]
MKFHVFATGAVLGLSWLFHIPGDRLMFVLLAITLVLSAELFNTAIEKTVDLAMPTEHPLAKIAKDTAAGAVLVTAVFAIIVFIYVFAFPLKEWLGF